MRGNIALVSLLMAGLLVSAGPAVGVGLPEVVPGGLLVELPDGDRFQVHRINDGTALEGQRYDGATGQWSAGQVLVRDSCSDFDIRTAAGALVVVARCDRDSYGLYSPDTVTWTTHAIEAGDVPATGISPDGRHAVWSTRTGYATWDAADGWVVRDSLLPDDGPERAAVVTDDGTVSLVQSNAVSDDGAPCTLTVWATSAEGATVQQIVPVGSCRATSLSAVDMLTLQLGDADEPHLVTTISRLDAASPWAVSAIAPVTAPGLIRHRGKLSTQFLAVAGLPLIAVGSADTAISAQTYDATAQRWSPPTEISRTKQECAWEPQSGGPFGVYAHRMRCAGRERLLASTDGQHWRGVWLGRHPLGIAPSRAWVSASNRRRTLIFSRERGVVRLPVGTSGRCDIVAPSAPDAAVRLTGPKKVGWPRVLQESTTRGWRRTNTVIPTLPVGTARCRKATNDTSFDPPTYRFDGFDRGGTASWSLSILRPRDGQWLVRRPRD